MTHSVTQPGVVDDKMYLVKRANGVWYFRRRIPGDVKGFVEPGLFHFSLGKRTRQEAMEFYAAALARSEQEISNARKKIQTAAEGGHGRLYPSLRERSRSKAARTLRTRTRAFCQYDEGAIDALVSRWFEKAKREEETYYRDAFLLNSLDERMEILQELREIQSHLLGRVPEMQDWNVSGTVRSILELEDCDLPRDLHGDPLFRRFYGMVLATTPLECTRIGNDIRPARLIA